MYTDRPHFVLKFRQKHYLSPRHSEGANIPHSHHHECNTAQRASRMKKLYTKEVRAGRKFKESYVNDVY